ncbi:MAG: YbbR-like domain-containing protein [Saprospiraceae bacterium]
MDILQTKIRFNNPFASKSPEDRTVLVICFAIAFFFWLMVKLSKDYTIVAPFSLVYELPTGRAFVNSPPQVVYANLRASGWSLIRYTVKNAKKYALRYPVGNADIFSVSTATLRDDIDSLLSDGILITDLLTEGIIVQIEKQATRKIPVVAHTQLTFASEYGLTGDIHTTPDSVVITGPRSVIDTIQVWATDSLLLKGLDQSVAQSVALRQTNGTVRIEPTEVLVHIPVQRYIEKTFQLPITIVHTNQDSVRVFPDKVTLTCVLGLDDFDLVVADDFEVVAHIPLSNHGLQNAVIVELTSYPDYVRSWTITPRSVEYLIQRD